MSGSVPRSSSKAFTKPSPSGSAPAMPGTLRLFTPHTGIALELPMELDATTVYRPNALAAIDRLSVADAPEGSVVAELTVMPGPNWKVDAARFRPVTRKLATVVPDSAAFGVTEVITGVGRTVRLVPYVTVVLPTVTEIGPDVAVTGSWMTSVVAVAKITVAATPSTNTVFAEGVVLNPCP